MKPRKTRVANHRLALFPIAVTVGVLALVAWAAISLAQPPIPHAGPQGAGNPGEFPDCLSCHQSGVVGSPRVASDHTAYQNEDCGTCHDFLAHVDASYAHSELLVGRHTELWCEDCHEGVQRPGSQCADCHEPVPVPHFGTECEDCHTPEGFGEADAGDFEHPLVLEGAHATLACSDCHVTGQELSSDCAACHQPPSEPHFGTVCQDCHTPEGFEKVDVGAFEHPVALEGAHADLACSSCHTTDQKLVYDCAACHQPPSEPHFGAACQDCHTPEGFKDADVQASAVDHPVALEGAHASLACTSCHATDQKLVYDCAECHQPPSQPHFGTACENCHTPEGFEVVDVSAVSHPVALEGAHADLACSSCHTTDRQLVYDCAECHQPPSLPHYGTACQDCHTPEGFEVVDASAVSHPVALEGAHAALACSRCHTGGRQLTYDCAECHQPPSQPHFGNTCQDCHTPTSFRNVDLGAFTHPVALEGAHAALACSSCHTAGKQLTYDCAECHQPPSQPHFGDVCRDCHTPDGFEDADVGAFEHPVALEGAHAELACSNCHTGNQQLTYECYECHEPPGDSHFGSACQNCHTPQGWSESAEHLGDEAEEIPHDLEGREDCLLCHDPEGQVKPAPASHAGYVNSQCMLCHRTES
jgi:hypothetical protein